MSTESMVKKNQLSQSLQDMLTMIENQLSENERNVATNSTRLSNIVKLNELTSADLEKLRASIDEEVTMDITNIPVSGARGPVTRYFMNKSNMGDLGKIDIDRTHIFGHAECIRCLAYTTDEEMNDILSIEFLEEKCIDNNIEPAMYNLTTGLRRVIHNDYNLSMIKERTSLIPEYIPNRVWLVNPITHKIYFHMFVGKYIDLSNLCDANTGKTFVDGVWINDIVTRW